ncbi:MAG: Peroxide-responsive repressor PerR [Calditrichaeota bacterium]|nr:Peroxide-responsive repressor PerR [Calditrichota bacterium]
MTAQRKAVLDVLHRWHDHPTADEVFLRVRKLLPKVSLATVYRNLDVLAEQDEIQVIEFPGQPRRYDAVTRPHYHIVCVECGRVEDIHLDRVPDLGALVQRTGAYEVLATRLEFEGRCSRCRAR